MTIKIGTKILAITDLAHRVQMQVTAKLEDGNYLALSKGELWLGVINPTDKTIAGRMGAEKLVKYVEIVDA